MPLGFDLLHFGYQTALQGLGQPPAVAAATLRLSTAPVPGIDGEHAELRLAVARLGAAHAARRPPPGRLCGAA